MLHPDEADEWLAGRVESWIETYKKAMMTPLVLQIVADLAPVGIADVATALQQRTGWGITERGLYRTVQRLESSGYLTSREVDAARTGARRKLLGLTDVGERYLDAVRGSCITLAPKGRS